VTATPARQGQRLRWALVAGLAGAAASTLATVVAAAVAGRQADLALQPVELALRVGLLLGAPCVGAVLAAVVVPRGGGFWAVAAVGLGVPVGPLLVLRLDRVREFGLTPTLLTAGVMLAWGVVGAALAAGWWARPSRRVQRTELPTLGLTPASSWNSPDPSPPGGAPLRGSPDPSRPTGAPPRGSPDPSGGDALEAGEPGPRGGAA
jgi:hypothetical protein